ncbi:MAG: WD40/YVTN/BNR-like repeat-containing protein [Chitinophagaceae bacterium]
MKWRSIGPWRAGRCLAVTGVPNQPLTYYMGATGGGIWKTTDGGNTWISISDSSFHSSSVGALAVAASNTQIIYAGMGERDIRSDLSFGDGVYKTTNGGQSWHHIGLKKSYSIAALAVNPNNPDLVYAAAMGNTFVPNATRGLFRSSDGGKTWNRILFKNDSTGCVDVKIDPSNPLILYASLWQAYRTPYSLSSGGPGSGLYQSEDGGDTWKLLSQNPGMPKGILGKIICAVSPANGNRLYALVENKVDGGAFFRSDDGGTTWKLMTTQNDLTVRPWYFSNVVADPKDENVVYVENNQFWKSIDGGKTFASIANDHVDNHAMWINPNQPQNFIMGDDGGAEVTFNGGKTFSAEYLPTGEFYHVNLDNTFPYHIYGDQQDNSSICISSRSSLDTVIGADQWYQVAGGESGYIVPDPTHPNLVYGGGYMGMLNTYNKITQQFHDISPFPEDMSGHGSIDYKYRFNWTFPIVFSPFHPQTLYVTSQYVHRSRDGGESWKIISPDLTRNDPKTEQPSGGPINLDNTGAEAFPNIFAFAASSVQEGILWAGSDDGLIHISTNDGKDWVDVTPPTQLLPSKALISMIEPSQLFPGTAFVAATRYQLGDNTPYLLKTTNFGKTWELITAGLPAHMYTRCIREDPNDPQILYCGTETGIYLSFDLGMHWQSLQLNLPLTPVHDIQVQKRDEDLVIATHGRGFWILDDLTPLYQIKDSLINAHSFLFAPRFAYRTAGGQSLAKNIQAGTNAPNGALIHYYFAKKPLHPVQLIFLTQQGDTVISYSSNHDATGKLVPVKKGFYSSPITLVPAIPTANSGMNTFLWNLQYAPPVPPLGGAVTENPLIAPTAVPGNYKVQLLDGDSLLQTQIFPIQEDPRIKVSLGDLNRQLVFLKQINASISADYQAVNKIRNIKKQITQLLGSFTDSLGAQTLRKSATPFLDSMNQIEDVLIQPKSKAPEDPIRFPVQINDRLAGLAGSVASADAAPNPQEYELFRLLDGQLKTQLGKLRELLQLDIPPFNKKAASWHKMGISILIP